MKRAWYSTVLLALILAGCSVLKDNNAPLDETLAARRRWERLNIDYYTYEFRKSCECLPAGKVRVYVEADTVHSATYVDTGLPVLPESGVQLYTIDGLFGWLIDELRDKPAEARIWFDPAHHFPNELYLDRATNTIDDELWLYVQNFQKHERLD